MIDGVELRTRAVGSDHVLVPGDDGDVYWRVFGVLAMVAFFVGAVPMGLGLLVVIPALIVATYLSYKEVFA